MIELSLTIKQARKVHKVLGGICTDKDVADVYYELERWLKVQDERAAKLPPWRKVKETGSNRGYPFEVLECGHRYSLKWTSNWVEDHAKKRRCESCAQQEKAK